MHNTLLQPFSWLYKNVTDWRNRAYDKGLLSAEKLRVPVVAVGNLTLGGTGKTPVICELVQWALDQNIQVGIVSRGYKGKYKGVVKVGGILNPGWYGDEPAMMAAKFPQVPIYLSASKVEAAQRMLASERVQFILVDDAFQHRKLQRDLNILVMDATEPVENYAVVPAGRARESISGLLRADFIILNKMNLASEEQRQKVLNLIETQGKSLPIIECDYYIQRWRHLTDGKVHTGQAFEKVTLVSGIGNPSAFEALVRQNFDVKKHFVFADHVNYKQTDIKKVVSQSKHLGVEKIIVTEKDAVKIQTLATDLDMFWVADLKPKLSLKVKELYEQIHKLLR